MAKYGKAQGDIDRHAPPWFRPTFPVDHWKLKTLPRVGVMENVRAMQRRHWLSVPFVPVCYSPAYLQLSLAIVPNEAWISGNEVGARSRFQKSSPLTTELGQRLPSGMHGHAHVPATLFLLSASYLGSHSFPTPSSHQGLERGEETSKYILKDLGFLFHVSFCMRFHESPEIPKSRHQQASITENLHSLDLSPKESAHKIAPAWPTIPQLLPDLSYTQILFFIFQ